MTNEKVISEVLHNCLFFITHSTRNQIRTYHVARVIQFLTASTRADEWFAKSCTIIFPQLYAVYTNVLTTNDVSLNIKQVGGNPPRLTHFIKRQPCVLKTISSILKLAGELCELTEDQLDDDCLSSLQRMLDVSICLIFDLGGGDGTQTYLDLLQNYKLSEVFREASFNVTGILEAFPHWFAYARPLLHKHIHQIFKWIGSPLEVSIQKSSLTLLKLIYNHAHTACSEISREEPVGNPRAPKESSDSDLRNFKSNGSESNVHVCAVIVDKIKSSPFWSAHALSTFVHIQRGKGNSDKCSSDVVCDKRKVASDYDEYDFDTHFPLSTDDDDEGEDTESIMSKEQEQELTKDLFESNNSRLLKCVDTPLCDVQISVEGQCRGVFKQGRVHWNVSSIATRMDSDVSYWPLFSLKQFEWRRKPKSMEEIKLRFAPWDEQKAVDISVRFVGTQLTGDLKNIISTTLRNAVQVKQEATG